MALLKVDLDLEKGGGVSVLGSDVAAVEAAVNGVVLTELNAHEQVRFQHLIGDT
jgi:hypothetical protein